MKFWQFRASASNPKIGELMLYGVISSESWWGDEVTPKTFKDDLDALGDIEELHVFINSGGGDVFAGQAIHSMLKRHKAKVVVHIDGLAASIASVIAMAGDVVRMPRNAMMMVHNPWTIAMGNAADFRKLADDLDRIGESLVAAYEEKTGLPRDEIVALMEAETWMTADDAVAKGFADEIEQAKQVAASLKDAQLTVNDQTFDLSRFRNRPAVALAAVNPATSDPQGIGRAQEGSPAQGPKAAGRTLSAANEDKLKSARDAIDEVLAQVADAGSAQRGGSDPAPDDRLDEMAAKLEGVLTELTALRNQHNLLRKRVALLEPSTD